MVLKKEKAEDVLNEAVLQVGCYGEACLPVLAEFVIDARFKAAVADQTSLKLARDLFTHVEVDLARIDAKLELLRELDQHAAVNEGSFDPDEWIEKLKAQREDLLKEKPCKG